MIIEINKVSKMVRPLCLALNVITAAIGTGLLMLVGIREMADSGSFYIVIFVMLFFFFLLRSCMKDVIKAMGTGS
jgi:hypothetical protein